MQNPASWRLALAQRVAAVYAASPNAAAVMIAGSVGRGRDDRYSDLEIDVYYHRPPTAAEREACVAACGARLIGLDEDEDEWEEQMDFNGFHAATSTFLVATLERYLEQVVDRCEVAPLAQARLYSLQNSLPFSGQAAIAGWRAKAARYPDGLVRAMLSEHLPFHGFGYAEQMLAARDDRLALYAIFVEIERQILGALLGLNRVYLPTPEFIKSMDETIAAFAVRPPDLSRRMKAAFQADPSDGVRGLKALVTEVFDLVDRHFPSVETSPYREKLARSRPVFDSPPGGLPV
jgi:hypothetical protein